MDELQKRIAGYRKDYMGKELDVSSVSHDPFAQFTSWFQEAIDSGIEEPNAMTLATADTEGRPTARVVLLRGFDECGFVFYTNYNSRKGRNLSENPCACLNFFWPELSRQVRVEGTVERVLPEISDAYFNSRPRENRIGAWASEQSLPISGRDMLDRQQQRAENEFEGKEIPRPQHWGGFMVKPHYFEFWQGRPSRLHDRISYRKSVEDNGWLLERLSP
jgi:pyridoxamine 5'-phosphate oxidase